MNLLKEITYPIKVNNKLVHLGRKADGGYIIDDLTLASIKRCYTYGVADEISFETDLIHRNLEVFVHLYDHTVDAPPLPERMVFHKEGLIGQPNGSLDNFFNHLFKNNDASKMHEILLKLDAEGAEYDLFNTFNPYFFNELPSMIVEFHDVNARLGEFMHIISNLNKYFHIIHIHPNNCGGQFDYQGFIFPTVPEITFLNRKNLGFGKNYIKYPIDGLDFKNEPSRPNFEINFTND
jgi:hypothetical protein